MPRLRTIPLPPITPGSDNYQSTQKWADASARQASTSLAVAKPIYTEDGDQSEVSSCLPR